MANLVRCFCQSVKICFEIALMATDAGLLISVDNAIAMAGTASGSDAILVFVELALDDKNAEWDEQLVQSFNPCFRGTCS